MALAKGPGYPSAAAEAAIRRNRARKQRAAPHIDIETLRASRSRTTPSERARRQEISRTTSPTHRLPAALRLSFDEWVRLKPIERKAAVNAGVFDPREIPVGARRSQQAGSPLTGLPGLLGNAAREGGQIAKGTPGALYGIAHAVGSDVKDEPLSLAAGGWAAVAGPLLRELKGEDSETKEKVLKPQAEYYKGRYYDPIRKKGLGGGLKEIGHEFYERPVSGSFDIASVLAPATKGLSLAKGGVPIRHLEAKPAGSRGVIVNPTQSPNALTAYLQHAYDRFSERHTDARGVGATSRVAREKSREIGQEQSRRKARAYPQAHAIQRMSWNRITNSRLRERLYWEAQLPEGFRSAEGFNALLTDLRAAHEKATGPKQAKKLERKIARIERSLKQPRNHAFDAALDAARVLSDERKAILIEAGLLNPATAAAREALIARRLGLEGSSDIFVGHRSKRAPKSVERLGRSRVSGGPISTKGMGLSQNELKLYQQGRLRVDPDVIIEDWARAQTFKFHNDIKQFFGDLAQPIGPDGPNPGWYLVNPKGKSKPEWWNDAIEAADPNSLGDALKDYVGSYIATDSAGAEILVGRAAAPGDILQLDPKIAHQFFNRLVGPQGAAGAAGPFVVGADLVNGLVKFSLIYANLGYIPANFVGNLVFAGIHQGPFLPANLVRAGTTLAKDRERARLIQAEVGEGPTLAVASSEQAGGGLLNALPTAQRKAEAMAVPPSRGKRARMAAAEVGKAAPRDLLRLERRSAQAIGRVPDVWPRMAAWYFEARKAGFKTRKQQMELLTDPRLAHRRQQVSDNAQEAMVRFDVAGPVEKAILGRMFFVWPWIRGASHWATRMPLDRPVRTALLAHGAEAAQQEQDAALPDRPSWADQFIQTNPLQRGPLRNVINPASISPTGTALDIVRKLSGTGNYNVFEALRPDIQAGVNIAQKKGPAYSSGYQPTYGSYAEALKANVEDLVPTKQVAEAGIEAVRGGKGESSSIYKDNEPLDVLKRRAFRFLPVTVKTEGLAESAARETGKTKATLVQELHQELARANRLYQNHFGVPLPKEYTDAYKRRWRVREGEKALLKSQGVRKLSEAQKTAIRMSVALETQPGYKPYVDSWLRLFEWARHDPLDEGENPHGRMTKLRYQLEGRVLGYQSLAKLAKGLRAWEDQAALAKVKS